MIKNFKKLFFFLLCNKKIYQIHWSKRYFHAYSLKYLIKLENEVNMKCLGSFPETYC